MVKPLAQQAKAIVRLDEALDHLAKSKTYARELDKHIEKCRGEATALDATLTEKRLAVANEIQALADSLREESEDNAREIEHARTTQAAVMEALAVQQGQADEALAATRRMATEAMEADRAAHAERLARYEEEIKAAEVRLAAVNAAIDAVRQQFEQPAVQPAA
ncbi:MAG: hypothetical protein ACREB3_06985 [Burkholderiales bacterium]